MRFGFRELPDPGPDGVRGRPIVDVVVEGLEIAPQACLLDSGATAVRFGAYLAELEDSYAWTAPVWFCEPWLPAFGLLGLTGFFDHFEVTIASYEEWIELTPINP